jgi:hypothetical protein
MCPLSNTLLIQASNVLVSGLLSDDRQLSYLANREDTEKQLSDLIRSSLLSAKHVPRFGLLSDEDVAYHIDDVIYKWSEKPGHDASGSNTEPPRVGKSKKSRQRQRRRAGGPPVQVAVSLLSDQLMTAGSFLYELRHCKYVGDDTEHHHPVYSLDESVVDYMSIEDIPDADGTSHIYLTFPEDLRVFSGERYDDFLSQSFIHEALNDAIDEINDEGFSATDTQSDRWNKEDITKLGERLVAAFSEFVHSELRKTDLEGDKEQTEEAFTSNLLLGKTKPIKVTWVPFRIAEEYLKSVRAESASSLSQRTS